MVEHSGKLGVCFFFFFVLLGFVDFGAGTLDLSNLQFHALLVQCGFLDILIKPV